MSNYTEKHIDMKGKDRWECVFSETFGENKISATLGHPLVGSRTRLRVCRYSGVH